MAIDQAKWGLLGEVSPKEGFEPLPGSPITEAESFLIEFSGMESHPERYFRAILGFQMLWLSSRRARYEDKPQWIRPSLDPVVIHAPFAPALLALGEVRRSINLTRWIRSRAMRIYEPVWAVRIWESRSLARGVPQPESAAKESEWDWKP
jgi:hypothetical protein